MEKLKVKETPEKTFTVRDKTGRGYHCSTTASRLLAGDNDIDYNGEELHQWVKGASCGDKWENEHEQIIHN